MGGHDYARPVRQMRSLGSLQEGIGISFPLETPKDATRVVGDLFGPIESLVTRLAVVLTSIGRAPDLLEDVGFIRVQAESFDDVFALSRIGGLIFSLGMLNPNEVVVDEPAFELGLGIHQFSTSTMFVVAMSTVVS